MRAMLVLLIVAALFAAALPFAEPAHAREGALAPPSLRERAEDGARVMEWEGASALTVQGACLGLLRMCLGANETEDGRFFLPASATRGQVLVTWEAVNDSLRELRVSVGGATKVGASPMLLEFPGAVAGEYAVHAEPNGTVAGSWEQPIAWIATFTVLEAPEETSLEGAAGYTTTTGCALVTCAQTLRQHSDPLVVPWDARGQVVLDWDPSLGALRVAIAGTSFAAEGSAPLTLPVDGLPAGEWRLEVQRALALPLSRVDVRWSAHFVEKASS